MNEDLRRSPVNPTPTSSPQNTAKLRQLSLHNHHHQQPSMRYQQSQPQPDEGYSEDPTTLSDSEMSTAFNEAIEEEYKLKVKTIIGLIMELPEAKRKEIAEVLISTLPNTYKEQLKVLIDHLTHFDPAIYLPNELFLSVSSYLSPRDLLSASQVSRAWHSRSQDEKLWRACFAREGWILDRESMSAYERREGETGKTTSQSGVVDMEGAKSEGDDGSLALERRRSRKRGPDEAFSESEIALASQAREPESMIPNLDGVVDELVEDEKDSEAMEGVEVTSPIITDNSKEHEPIGYVTNPADFTIAPPVFQPSATPQHPPKLSWPYLYKQRRRLETNWDTGKYKTFQLPHPDHLEEGHRECVYTIQHTARHLVSGSRDKTIRIWDLSTQRLKRKPLVGHEASVLCLLFDERPDQDIIVSGGSDNYVLIWKFSTGEVVKRLTAAHDESVLNLRFDDRYIITCSKDKTIKIWNRHALARDSPNLPSYVLETFTSGSRIGADGMIAEFSLLTTLIGHNAAVNAVMIHEDTIVSASGDRTMKSWDISTGMFRRNYTGHTKGIACVQFDGRRIVSGSSDNTVRIFDASTQAEVACLTGHSNLVRTVQARFGDLDIMTEEELAEEARQADLGFYSAVSRGMRPAALSRRHGGGVRNAGSSRPEDMLAVGTKVPPGGGGSRWAKIVSGSYDETVILWKRNSDGNWVPRLRLRQDDILRAANRRASSTRPADTDAADAPAAAGNNGLDGTTTIAQAQTHHHISTAQGHLAQANHLIQTQHHQGQAHQLLPASQMAAMASAQNHLSQHLGQHAAAQQTAVAQAQVHAQAQAANAAPVTATATNQQQANGNPAANAPQAVQAVANQALQQNQQQVAAAPANNAAGAGIAGAGGVVPPQHRESNRVFKLQFDARRIVCCSQNKTIVGWDFANGDEDLERIGEWSLETA